MLNISTRPIPSEGEPGKRYTVPFGGSPLPDQGIQSFVTLAGGSDAKILVVSWATHPEERKEAFEEMEGIFRRAGVTTVYDVPVLSGTARGYVLTPHDIESAREPLCTLLSNVTGVFFTGGAQDRLMEAIERLSLGPLLKECYGRGVIFAGNSAGAAALSRNMIVEFLERESNRPRMGDGIGILEEPIIETQYGRNFPDRQERLEHAVIQCGGVGIGLHAESAALIEEDGATMAVWVLAGEVVAQLHPDHGGECFSFGPGDHFNLSEYTLGEDLRRTGTEG